MRTITSAVVAAAALLAASGAAAQVTEYTNAAAFSTAAGKTQTETFNTYTKDTSFQNKPLAFGGFTLVGTGTDQSDRNLIDVQPYQETQYNINGTPLVNAYASPNSGLVFTFTSPINSFGAIFNRTHNDDGSKLSITIGGQPFMLPNLDSPGFVGFTSTSSFSTVSFSNAGAADGFAIDDVQFGAVSAAPEPGAWALMMLGVGAIGAMLGYRKRVIVDHKAKLAAID